MIMKFKNFLLSLFIYTFDFLKTLMKVKKLLRSYLVYRLLRIALRMLFNKFLCKILHFFCFKQKLESFLMNWVSNENFLRPEVKIFKLLLSKVIFKIAFCFFYWFIHFICVKIDVFWVLIIQSINVLLSDKSTFYKGCWILRILVEIRI